MGKKLKLFQYLNKLKFPKKAFYAILSLIIVILCIAKIIRLYGIQVIEADAFDKEISIYVNIRCTQPIEYNDYYSITDKYTYSYSGSLIGGFFITSINQSIEKDSIDITIQINQPSTLKFNEKSINSQPYIAYDGPRIFKPGTTIEEIQKQNKEKIGSEFNIKANPQKEIYVRYFLSDIGKNLSYDISTIRLRLTINIFNKSNSLITRSNLRKFNFNVPLTEELLIFDLNKKLEKSFAESHLIIILKMIVSHLTKIKAWQIILFILK